MASRRAWAQRARPLTDPHPGWLVLGVAVTLLCATAAVLIAGRRDVGGALWQGTRGAGRAPRSLETAGVWGGLGGWAVGVAAFCFMTGMISASVGAIARAGGRELSRNQVTADVLTPRGYLSTVLLMMSALVAVYASRGALRAHDEEVAGRFGLVLAGPAHRRRWLVRRSVLAFAGAALLMALAGLGGWAGAHSRGIDLGLGEMLGAGLVALAPIAVFLGAAVLALGAAPRLTGAVATGGAGVMLLAQLVAESLDGPSWVTWLSPFAHAAQAPLHAVHWDAIAGLGLTGAALTLVGIHAFGRRDLGGP